MTHQTRKMPLILAELLLQGALLNTAFAQDGALDTPWDRGPSQRYSVDHGESTASREPTEASSCLEREKDHVEGTSTTGPGGALDLVRLTEAGWTAEHVMSIDPASVV